MEQQYLNLLKDVLENGSVKDDRTGTGTLSVFGRMIRHDLNDGFPLITTKKLHIRSIIYELLWFLKGDTNIKWLNDHGVTIWDEWADENGELGHIYGGQWNRWPFYSAFVIDYIDQIRPLIEGLKKNPNSRRHIVSAWNVAYLPDENKSPQENVADGKMALAPCHVMNQFYVNEGKLSCLVTQRSADLFLGLPFNIASYAFLTHMIAQQTDLVVGELIFSLGDCHIYSNHIEQVREQLNREPRDLPILAFNRKPYDIDDYRYDDFLILGYYPHDAIKAPIAV